MIADDQGGQIITSTNPSGGAGAWRTTTRLPAPSLLHPYGFAGISCPTTRFCAAIDSDGGNVVTSSDPAGSSWRVAHVGRGVHKLSQITCASASLCDTLDSDGNLFTSIDPLGSSRGWVYDNSLLSPIMGSGGWTLSCPSMNLCVGLGVGQVDVFTDPGGTARLAAKPHVSHAGISRVARHAPRLRLTVTSGVPPGQAAKSIALELPRGLSFTHSPGGLLVLGSSGRPVGFKARVSRGRLTIVLAKASSNTSITVSPSALKETGPFASAVAHHRLGSVPLRMIVVDAGRVSTTLYPRVRVMA
ncbi:MAG: hypothetical protein M3065_07845 [Actinomycetota bacterium]|nr:hypothetical protein [Actinomycetota bacterium]